MRRYLQSERGFGLVELLIAMTVLQIAVFALIAALSSSHLAVLRSAKTTTAAALASAEIELYRRVMYVNIPVPITPATEVRVGADGRSYTLIRTSVRQCPNGDPAISDSVICTVGGRPIKVVSVEVRDANGKTLVRQATAFDRVMGS